MTSIFHRLFRYVTRFNSDGLESLLKDKTRKPGKTPVSVETKHKIGAIACKEKPKDDPHGSVRSLAKRVDVSKSRVNHILRERGIKPHLVQFRNDETFEEKLADVVGLDMNRQDNAIVRSVDEKFQIQALERIRPLLPLGENIPAGHTAEYERHGTRILFGALNGSTGEVIGAGKGHHKVEDYLEFLQMIVGGGENTAYQSGYLFDP